MKVYLAGYGTPAAIDAVEKAEHKYLLFSYEGLSRAPTILKRAKQLKKSNPDVEFILDSGAHTLQKGVVKVNYDLFFYNYLKFLKENPIFNHYVELDIENVVGMEKVAKWTNILKTHLNTPPIEVWHRWRGGDDVWEEMTESSDYIGLSGFLINSSGGAELDPKRLPEYLRIAKKNDCKVHGFGLTNPKVLMKNSFYSVDSTSWMVPIKYGKFQYLYNSATGSLDKVPYNALGNHDYYWQFYWNALQWKKFADVLAKN